MRFINKCFTNIAFICIQNNLTCSNYYTLKYPK